jgi:hypothetical protein
VGAEGRFWSSPEFSLKLAGDGSPATQMLLPADREGTGRWPWPTGSKGWLQMAAGPSAAFPLRRLLSPAAGTVAAPAIFEGRRSEQQGGSWDSWLMRRDCYSPGQG